MRKPILLALALIAPLLAACMPDTPETKLSWDVNDRLGKTHKPASTVARNDGARTYAYEDKYASPSPRPAPNYVTPNTPYAPQAYKPVSSKPLDPVSTAPAPVVVANAPAFAWPVSGRVLSEFGSTSSGGHNDGINIGTAMSAPIHASASGTVTYAGNELKNYGNLVLIKHSGGFTTAYAHADRLTVAKGDFVARGQVIGYSGQTGDVSAPQLHFEIRANTTPVNPRTYLSSTTARN